MSTESAYENGMASDEQRRIVATGPLQANEVTRGHDRDEDFDPVDNDKRDELEVQNQGTCGDPKSDDHDNEIMSEDSGGDDASDDDENYGDEDKGMCNDPDEDDDDGDDKDFRSISNDEGGIICDEVSCRILHASGIGRRFTAARLAEHKLNSHLANESPEEKKLAANLLAAYRGMFPEEAASVFGPA